MKTAVKKRIARMSGAMAQEYFLPEKMPTLAPRWRNFMGMAEAADKASGANKLEEALLFAIKYSSSASETVAERAAKALAEWNAEVE